MISPGYSTLTDQDLCCLTRSKGRFRFLVSPAAVANFVWPGSKFAVLAVGHFANRMIVMSQRQRANVVRLEKPWGEVFTAEKAQEFIERERPEVVGFVLAETSTGAYESGRALAARGAEGRSALEHPHNATSERRLASCCGGLD